MDASVVQQEPGPKEMTDLLLRVMEGINAQAFRLWGNRVMTGPFTGMIIPERSPWKDGNASTKLVGTYEHELHGALEFALWRKPKVVVNVGCGDGYYAIGLARKGFEVYALDLNEDCRIICEDFAELNKVKVNLIDGAREAAEMRLPEAIEGHRLYVVDVEGFEEKLLDLEGCPELVHSDIIVECHDFLMPDISSRLADRFSATHAVELVRMRLPDLRFLEKMPTAMGVLAVIEKRPAPTHWLTCWANRKLGPHPK